MGLCIADTNWISDDIIEWGNRAKVEILTKVEAHKLALEDNIILEGLTGEKIGVIGSLAAVGLRAEGNDGRILWLPYLREISGSCSSKDLKKLICLDRIETIDGNEVDEDSIIVLTDWTRPVVKDKKITLIVQITEDHEKRYTIASKEFIKSITE